MGHGLYTAKDVNSLLGISPKTLYHWVQTRRLLTPTTEGKGRGKSNIFDIDAMATLYLIKLLNNYGFELGAIGWMIRGLLDKHKSKKTIWQTYRESINKFNKEGLFLTILPLKEGKQVRRIWVSTFEDAKFYLWSQLIGYDMPYIKGTDMPKTGIKQPANLGAMIINLLELIKEVERKIGLSF